MIRELRHIATLVGVTVLTAVSCGGRIDFVTQKNGDVRVPRVSGAACAKFDTSVLFQRPTCDEVTGKSVCNAWGERALAGFPFACSIACKDGTCAWPAYECVNGALLCEQGSAGDAACQKIVQEYVKGDGVAVASCVPGCKSVNSVEGISVDYGPCEPPNTPVGACVLNVCGADKNHTYPNANPDMTPPLFCVRRNGVVNLEFPCQDP